MKNNIPYIFDSILSKIVCFVIGLLTGGWFIKSLTDIILFALIFSVGLSEIYLNAISPRKKNKKPDKKQLAVKNVFIYADDRFALDYFFKALSKKYETKRCRKFIGVNKTALFCRIKPSPLTADAFIDMYAYALKRGYSRLVVLTDSYEPICLQTAKSLPSGEAEILGFDGVYRLMKSLNAVPDAEIKTEKRKLKSVLFEAFNKRRANGYLLLSVTLFLLSRFTAFSVYYLLAASAALVLSFAIRFIPSPDKSKTTK